MPIFNLQLWLQNLFQSYVIESVPSEDLDLSEHRQHWLMRQELREARERQKRISMYYRYFDK